MRAIRGRRVILIALVALAAAVIIAGGTGSVRIAPGEVLRILLSRAPGASVARTWVDTSETILWDIRFPRVMLALVTGIALSVAGGAFQGLFKNPMADPYILGVSPGAALGASIMYAFGEKLGVASVPLAAFSTGLLVMVLVYRLAAVGRRVPVTGILLSGVAVGSFCMALVSLIIYVARPDARDSIIFWMMGGLSGANWSKVGWLSLYTAAGIAAMGYYGRELNAMLLGEESAEHLGVEVEHVKRIIIGAGALLVAATVSYCGPIGFVGLIVPHVMRFLVGPDHRLLLPASAVGGAVVVILADTLARTVASPMEIPIGLVMSILGGPFFLWLLRRKLKPAEA